MMKLEQGNMWSIYDETDYFIVTTNSYIRTDGAVVMGRGIAKQLAARVPKIPYILGDLIDHLTEYGVIMVRKHGAFQVKYHFKDPADLGLIHRAVFDLTQYAEAVPTKRFDMNFPGIGNGHLAYDDVLPLLQPLPDNVHVWTFGDNS
jgi:hypothetical protein